MNRVLAHNNLMRIGRLMGAIGLGFLALAFPIIIISLSVIFLGVYILIDGIFSMINAVRRRKTVLNWDMQFVGGMFGILAGVLTFFNPFVIIAAIVYLVFI